MRRPSLIGFRKFFYIVIATCLSVGQLAFTESESDTGAQELCNRLVSPSKTVDPDARGEGVDFDKIRVDEAVPACKQAAKSSSDPRYEALYGIALRADHKFKEAIEESKKAADRGSALAMINLGEAYARGEGVPSNQAAYVAWYSKAAEAGNVFAMGELGDRYMYGQGTAKDDAQASAWYRKAAEGGNPHAMTNLGYLNEYGRGVPQSYTEAFKWYLAATNTNDQDSVALAMAHIGYFYEVGHGVAFDAAEAVRWYKKAADLGNGNAMFNLGIAYQAGRGVPKNFKDAARWYYEAERRHYDKADLYIGVLYEYGWGVGKDLSHAMSYFAAAAKSDKPDVSVPAKRLLYHLQYPMDEFETEHPGDPNASAADQLKDMMSILFILAAASNNGSSGTPNYNLPAGALNSSTQENLQMQDHDNFCLASKLGAFGDDQTVNAFAGCGL